MTRTISIATLLALGGCIVVEGIPDGDPSGGGTSDPPDTEMCAFHCWHERFPSSFPEMPAKNDLGGNLAISPDLECTDGSGGIIDLGSVSFSVAQADRRGCSDNQADAEAMNRIYHDEAIANDQNAAVEPANEARERAVAYCIDILVGTHGCAEADFSLDWGADSVCRAWLGNHVYNNIRPELDFQPAMSEAQEVSSGSCDFEMLEDLSGADSDSSGGGVDLSDITCTGYVCEYDEYLHPAIFTDFSKFSDDGTTATFSSGTATGAALGIPRDTYSEDVFDALQLEDGDVITKLNGVTVKVDNLTTLIAELEAGGTYTFTRKRRSVLTDWTVRPL